MTDRELLELAAKAAGYAKAKFQDISGWGEVRYGLSEAMFVPEIEDYWNPLVDIGHALQLAAKLGINVTWKSNLISGGPGTVSAQLAGWHGIDPCEEVCIYREIAVRRAIVRAAASLGTSQ